MLFWLYFKELCNLDEEILFSQMCMFYYCSKSLQVLLLIDLSKLSFWLSCMCFIRKKLTLTSGNNTFSVSVFIKDFSDGPSCFYH